MSDRNDARPNVEPRSPPRDSKGWDGKLRVGKQALQQDPDVASEDESDDEKVVEKGGVEVRIEDGPPPQEIDADEDLLEDFKEDETDIDLNHCRISSIPVLRLERFAKLSRLCLRQNQISRIEFPKQWGQEIVDLDLYDNSISHIKGFEGLEALTSLDLSFNNIKHIKRVNHLKNLTNLYFVQNRIQKIEGLEGLDKLKNLELAANRIREIENLDTLKGLEELWLGKNKITELKNLSSLSSLKILSIQSNRLTSDSLAHLATLPHLTDLYVSHNALTSLNSLSASTSLRILDISSNPITSLSGLGPLHHLEELWASYCQFDDLREVEKELGDKKELTTVYFEGNPLQLNQPALYRNKVRLSLPQLSQIDATFVKVS